ncbi:phage tail assembly protein [Pseudoalteromonas sp.]|uniref:phage tail assembly protein n=1 Tax=Pseudoalteromonas sp. TaxID=53249 RepID=UPI002356C3BB|nr:phage tail assembly protein [Pseudoalteromonas sp.]
MNKLFKTHTLMNPLADVNAVDVHVVLFKAYEDAEVDHSGKDEAFTDAMIKAATSLTQEQINELSMPDFNSLEQLTMELINHSSEYFYDLENKKFNAESPMLLDPIPSFEKITYRVPSVKVSRLADTIQNTQSEPFKTARYLTTACTDLSDMDIDQLSVRDWNMLQKRITDFLQEQAGYFQ